MNLASHLKSTKEIGGQCPPYINWPPISYRLTKSYRPQVAAKFTGILVGRVLRAKIALAKNFSLADGKRHF